MGTLTFSYGTMDCGKSAAALQAAYNLRRSGRIGMLFTCNDRGGAAITSRLGIAAPAELVDPDLDFVAVVAGQDPAPDHVICDEAQFYTPAQIDQLAALADGGIDVVCFGILTDFASHLFPGSARLIELADQTGPLGLLTYCWCGRPAQMNARVVAERVVYTGDQVVVGDTVAGAGATYVVLCRNHWRTGAHKPPYESRPAELPVS